jgi:hypothetical protein
MTPEPRNGFGVFFFVSFYFVVARAFLLGVCDFCGAQNVVFAWWMCGVRRFLAGFCRHIFGRLIFSSFLRFIFGDGKRSGGWQRGETEADPLQG